MKNLAFVACLAVACTTFPAYAGVCDYRPSSLIGGFGAGATAAAGAGTALLGAGAKAAGFYTLTHATTGATMLASTAGGASAAGTVGIMGGTAGFIGTAAAIITAPATIIGAALVAVSVAGFESACYIFVDETITDTAQVHTIVSGLEKTADPDVFKIQYKTPGQPAGAKLLIKGSDGTVSAYELRNLYIHNGLLKHRDWFSDTVIGRVGLVVAEE